MTALETLSSLDRTLAEARNFHTSEMKALEDKLLAAQLEATLCKDALAKAMTERDNYMRVATRLITQFGTVEAVFAEAKQMALTIEHQNPEGEKAITEALTP